jgi:hypothetical protein
MVPPGTSLDKLKRSTPLKPDFFGRFWTFNTDCWSLRLESNQYPTLRRHVHYPLCYGEDAVPAIDDGGQGRALPAVRRSGPACASRCREPVAIIADEARENGSVGPPVGTMHASFIFPASQTRVFQRAQRPNPLTRLWLSFPFRRRNLRSATSRCSTTPTFPLKPRSVSA